MDWAIESTTIAACYVAIVPSGASYIGLFLYIDGMAQHLRMRMESINDERSMSRPQLWAIYLKEIAFHREIIGCVWNFGELAGSVTLFHYCF